MKKATLFLLITLCSISAFSQHLQVLKIKCANKENPAGIDQRLPRLSWQLQSDQRGVLQTAYRIIVADNEDILDKNEGNVWDSKKVNASSSIQVVYGGKPLQSIKSYYWKVQVWDNKNNVSAWSTPGIWQMGLLTAADWKGAKWIAYDKIPDSNVNILPTDGKKDKYSGNNILPLLRKEFRVTKSIRKATMFITGLGQFEMNVNGQKIGDHFLDPGWTKYDKQALYVTFDLTNELKQGENAIGVLLGNGFYYVPPVAGRYRKLKVAFGYPKMICRLAVEYSDGTQENVVSDNSWETAPGPITFSSIYGGEDYDATLEQPGWDKPGFYDRSWKSVVLVDAPATLNAQMAEPLKVMQVFTPVKVSPIKSGECLYDFGQNASGIAEITVQGKKGDTIRIIPSELLKADGTANQKASGGPYYWSYVLKGCGIETWRPRFTYYGFRYMQIAGATPKGESNPGNLPLVIDIKDLHTRNAAATTGTFNCSSDLFNRTFTLIDWSIKSNMASLFTDCPHREKLGWLEQDHLMGNSIQYNYDVAELFAKQMSDIRSSQVRSGLIPEIAPEYVKFEWGGEMFRDLPEWGSAGIILPWYLYQWYGDKQVLAQNYQMMERYASYLQKKAKGNILSQGLGDWYDLGPKPPGVSQLTPMGVTGTAIYYYDLNILTNIAGVLNKPGDVKKYHQLAAKVKQAFNDTFFNKSRKEYATGSQTANAMAVFMNLVEPQYKAAVVDNIVKDIHNRNNSLTAGDIGYRYLLKVLLAAGRSDVIFDMNSNAAVPGYGYQLAKGATALTESWAALPSHSNNHLMLGHLMEWFYEGLAGINQSETSIAYKNIVIKPEVVGDITGAKAEYECSYGLIKSDWKMKNNNFELNLTIPANTTATIYLPAGKNAEITEGKKSINKRDDIKMELSAFVKDKAILHVGSGNYTFNVKNK